MKHRLTVLMVAGALALLQGSSPLRAQVQDQQQPSNTDSNSTPVTKTTPVDESYSVNLGTGQSIPLTQGADSVNLSEPRGQAGSELAPRKQFLYGATASTVYMNDYATNSITDIVSGVVTPFVGVYLPTTTGGINLQYLATVAPDDAFTGNLQAYHAVSVNAVGAFTRRWYWGFSSQGEYGSETARFEGPLTYLLVGMVPVVDPVASGAFLASRTGAFAENLARLGWLRTDRDHIELAIYESYTDLSASPAIGVFSADRANTVGSKLDYTRDVNSRFRFDVFAQEAHLIESSCNTYGGGVGISAKLSHNWTLDASGGPQWTSANCGSQQNANFFGALTKALRRRAKFYVMGQRYFNTAFQTQSAWQDAVAAGILQERGRFSVQGDAGYFKGDPLLSTAGPLQGYYAAPLIRYKFTESTSISAGYRLFHATGGNVVPGSLHFATVSLEWHPAPIVFK